MLSINDIVNWANEKIIQVLPGAKFYGIAKTAAKDDKIMPYIDEKYIGIDDIYPGLVYHKLLSISSSTVTNSGYGDNETSLQNTYQMAALFYFDEKKLGVQADELYLFIQSLVTGRLKSQGFKSIRVNANSAVLNDAQVWAQEYGQAPLKLIGSQRLIQVNYNIVMVYDKKCITIPNCKN